MVRAGSLWLPAGAARQPLPIGDPAWWHWLDSAEARAFVFEHATGTYTARREAKPSGQYWYAYTRRAGRLHKAYLGRSADLSLDRLEAAASTLAQRAEPHTPLSARSDGGHPEAYADPILATKLLIPPRARTLVHRQRLLAGVDAGLHHKLTLLSAPAGFGKTTLLAEWASAHPGVAWITLDAADNDPTRFWSYVIIALQRAGHRVGIDAMALLRSPQPPPTEATLGSLLNDLAALDTQVLLALDDFQAIHSPAIHSGVSFFVEHLPPNAHVFIAGRADPPLPLARLRTRAQMVELRLADLRFTSTETAELLRAANAAGLTPAEIQQLEERTEGWPAGLQLAALSVRGNADAAGLISGISGANRYVLDYLADEVLLRQPPDVQAFLLHTSILSHLTGPLCDAVYPPRPGPGMRSGRDMLESLERANLFVVPLDSERRWYRYHHLFGEVLRERLGQTEPALVATLHLRAAGWCADRGLVETAISHALTAGDVEMAADLIESVARRTLMRSETATLTGWLARLPADAIATRPRLCLCQAWLVLAEGAAFELAEGRLRDAEHALDHPRPPSVYSPALQDTGEVRAEIDALRTMVALIKGDVAQALVMAEGTLARLAPDSFVRGVTAMGTAVLYMMAGELETAARTCEEAVRAATESDSLMIGVMALGNLAEARVAQGRLREAASVCRRAERLITDAGGHELPAAGIVEVRLGDLLREWNDLPAALAHLLPGIEHCRQLGEISAFDGFLFLARTRQAMGDSAGALDALAYADRLARRLDNTQLDDATVSLVAARIWLLQGNVEAAIRWADGWTRPERPELPTLYAEQRDLLLARVRLAQRRPEVALALVTPLLAPAQSHGRGRTVIEIRIIQALALAQQHAGQETIAHLELAAASAEPEGYVRVFADEGEPMRYLLDALLAARRVPGAQQSAAPGRLCSPAYVRTLLASIVGPQAREQAPPAPPQPLVEPLSERELEVLRLLAAGQPNRGIAEMLVIAETTAKWHVANVLAKLGARSRTQAIVRARELGLLA